MMMKLMMEFQKSSATPEEWAAATQQFIGTEAFVQQRGVHHTPSPVRSRCSNAVTIPA
jgi:hypothetical protein